MKKTVKDLLHHKGHAVCSISKKISVYQAIEIMADKRIGALLVMEGAALVGIFSERDYARKVALHGKSSKETPVGEVMSQPVCVVNPSQTVTECMALMNKHRFRHLPVMENSEVVGVISIGDVVNSIISEQSETIDLLETYITAK